MEKYMTMTGKTIDLAVAAALEQLNLDRDSVSVEVLDNPKSGFLGIGATLARVKITYDMPEPALSSASRSRNKNEGRPRMEKQTAPQEHKPKGAPAADRKPTPQVKKTPMHYEASTPGSVEDRIETFLKGLLAHMGSDATPHAVQTERDRYRVELVGDNLGMLIGRRGDTLDAIQRLANYAVNRGEDKRLRISVDAEDYRLKREEALQRLAKKVAEKVQKYHRNVTLEPMNAYERHVIHAALQDVDGITTFSTGSEPNRRIVVALGKKERRAE